MSSHRPLDPNEPAEYITDEAHLLHDVVVELRDLNARLARFEVVATALMTGKSAKWLALFAKSNAPGGRT